MNKKLISIIIPAYNAKQYILKILEDLDRINDNILEVIIVDDESKDDTLNIVTAWQSSHPYVLSVSIKNSKAGGARNEGLRIAKGEWIWFIDADDRIDTQLVPILLKHLDDSNDLIIFNGYWVSSDYKRYLIKNPPKQIYWNGHDFLVQGLKHHFFNVGPWNKLYRRSFLNEHQLMFTAHLWHEDYDFNTRVMLKNPRITVVNTPIYHMIKSKDSITTNQNLFHIQKLIQDSYFFIESFESIIKNHSFSPHVTKTILNDCAERRLKVRIQSQKVQLEIIQDDHLILNHAKFFKTRVKAIQAIYLSNILNPLILLKRKIQRFIEKK
jgi:glycosyltransferase involved in cell wall biosynthesis